MSPETTRLAPRRSRLHPIEIPAVDNSSSEYAVPIAILTNALRVSGTGVLAHYYGTRVADGFFHTFSGWVIYIAAAVLLFATGWVLDRFAQFGKRDRIYRMGKISIHSANPVNPV